MPPKALPTQQGTTSPPPHPTNPTPRAPPAACRYGDSNKLIRAVWTLAYKLQPCVIFVDEVDSLLGHR